MNEKSKKVKEAKINKKSHITLRTSNNKGITLVALIITIIVLLILAVVAIRAIQGDGIISHAKNAQTRYEQEQGKEQTTLESYLGMLEPEKVATTIEEAQSGAMLSKTVNSTLTDKYGNTIVVPAGFKILVDSTTDYTANTIDVTKGIVIQDASGNEFVWIPVGDVYTTEDTEKTESNTTTITLGRYSWNESTPNLEQPTNRKPYTNECIIYSGSGFQELQPIANGKGPNGNAIAKNINNFYEKAIASHGYYIGRFEAGVSGYDETETNNTRPSGEANWTKYKTAEGNDPQLVCKSNQQVWNKVTQNKASELCKSMYTNKPYESDLINSYAWDTAIVFIQTFGAEEGASSYASANKGNGLKQTGANQVNGVPDKYRNIYDMSGNAAELSTEESLDPDAGPCAFRGGDSTPGYARSYTSYRSGCGTTNWSTPLSFRPLLYV